MNDHIAKPLDLRQLFETLARWVAPASSEPPQPVERPSVCDQLRRAGFDVTGALHRLGDRLDLYLRQVARFLEAHQNFDAELRGAMAKRDIGTVARLVHTLKGQAGTIGATRLLAAATALETASRQQDDTSSETAETLAALADVMSSLQEVRLSAASAPIHPDGQWVTTLDRLNQQLVEGTTDAVETVTAIAANLHGQPGRAANFAAVVRAVESYDFDAARTALTAFRQGLSA